MCGAIDGQAPVRRRWLPLAAARHEIVEVDDLTPSFAVRKHNVERTATAPAATKACAPSNSALGTSGLERRNERRRLTVAAGGGAGACSRQIPRDLFLKACYGAVLCGPTTSGAETATAAAAAATIAAAAAIAAAVAARRTARHEARRFAGSTASP